MFFYGVDATKKPTAAPLGANNTYRSPFLCPQEESDLRAFFMSSIEHHPAQLRNAVYELARIKLRKEVCRTQLISLRRLTLALESAIESVETIYSNDGLRALRSLHRVSKTRKSAGARAPLLIIDQPAAQTAEANHRPKGAPSLLQIVQILPTDDGGLDSGSQVEFRLTPDRWPGSGRTR